MESSPQVFTAASPQYIHRELHSYDSGVDVTNLSKTIYISLDTFRSVVHNIDTELDAWLTFFSSDAPADIVKLVNTYPEFLSCYQDIMEFRRHPKELITMFSEALYIMDRNLERYMVEESKKEVEEARMELDAAKKELNASKKELDASKKELDVSRRKLDDVSKSNKEKDARIAELEAQLAARQK
jgi:hypothetical protein